MPFPDDAADVSDADLWAHSVEGAELPAGAAEGTGADTATQGQARDPAGRFAASGVPIVRDGVANPTPEAPAGQAQGQPAQEGQQAAQDGQQAAATPDPTAGAPDGANAPPKGWSPAAKAQWDALTPDVRSAIAKREEEVSAGFAQYSGLAKHAERVKASGRTLAMEADRYWQAEQNLANQPVPSLLYLCQAYGVHPQQLLEAAGGAPAGGQAQPRQAAPAMPAAQPIDVSAEVARVLDQRNDQTAVDQFFADPANRFAENVRPLMSTLIQGGHLPTLASGAPLSAVLKEAYDMACQADPQVRAAMAQVGTPAGGATPTPNAAASRAAQAAAARARSGSVTGAPPARGGSRDPGVTARAADAELWDDTVGA